MRNTDDRFTITYDPAFLEIDILNRMENSDAKSFLTDENARYLQQQGQRRRELICEETMGALWDEEDFQTILAVVLNETTNRHRTYDEAGN